MKDILLRLQTNGKCKPANKGPDWVELSQPSLSF
jgi:hypothetical protein